MFKSRPLSRLALGAALVIAATVLPGRVISSTTNASAVDATPIADSDFGPVADWEKVMGTDGRAYIGDANGRALQLHGFNYKTHDPAADITDEMLAAAAERGLDHYRMTVYWQLLEPQKDVFDDDYVNSIITAIKRSERYGIRVILDMHQDVYGEAFGSMGAPTWATMTDNLDFTPQASWLLNYLQPAVQAAFEHLYEDDGLRKEQIDAWLYVVERVKDLPGVIGYDLMNEPFGQLRPGEPFEAAAARVEREQLTPMYQRLTNAISAIDPDHWIFIEPPNLASLGIPTSLGEVVGPKVAIYPHMYDVSLEFSTYDPDSVDYSYDVDFFKKWAAAITTYTDKYQVPMLIGEWGIARPESHSMDEFVRETMRTLDEVSSGWSVFQFCLGGGYCAADAANNDRPNIGQIFVPYARAIAGSPTLSNFDYPTSVLSVSFANNDAQGPTEIFIPESRIYPNGFVVETTDADTTWQQTFDATTGVLRVSVPHTGGSHTICVRPVGSAPAKACADKAVLPPTTSTTIAPNTTTPDATVPTSNPTPNAPVAIPVSASPRYTG